MQKNNVPAFINIKGLDYISEELYMLRNDYTLFALGKARIAGLPHITHKGENFYNEVDCQNWHAGKQMTL
ncbi:MAG: hypothetical protein FWB80_00090 [Defluviitaleaceae bacterium]|nr:hypothetical protein [Defluviitaleaceae bacterium]